MTPTPTRLARDYERGLSHRALAAKYRVGEKTVRQLLAAAGVQSRPVGAPKARVSDEQIVAWRASGMTWDQVAQRAGMSSAGVRKRHAQAAGRVVQAGD